MAAGNNSAGEIWACVVVDTTHIQCGFSGGVHGAVFDWCRDMMGVPAQHPLPPHYSGYAGKTGLYMAPTQFPVTDPLAGRHQVAFLPVFFDDPVLHVTYMQVYEFSMVQPALTQDCVYDFRGISYPYIGPKVHPDVGHHLAVALDNTDGLYVFSTVPSSDAPAAGALLGVQLAQHGEGAITDLYNITVHGLTPLTAYMPDSPIAAVHSGLNGHPNVAVLHPLQKILYNVLLTVPSTWVPLQAAGLANAANQLAMVSMPNVSTGGILYSDATFAIDSAGNLFETRLEVKAGALQMGGPSGWMNNGAALNVGGTSLGASYYRDVNGNPLALAYALRDNTHGDVVASDYIANTKTWNGYFSDPNGHLNAVNFLGSQVVPLFHGSGTNLLFGACHKAIDLLCLMGRTVGAVTQNWSTY